MAKKTMMLSELINILKRSYDFFGDLPVYLQQDTEGNGYGTLKKESSFWAEEDDKTKKTKCIIIQPFEEHIDFDDLFKEE